MSFSADPLAPPRRPVLRITRAGGEEQVIVCPGPALGCAQWIGLIPEDATQILLAAAPSARLDRVERRSEASVFLACAWRKPGNALAALWARAKGQSRRYRDIVRGGVAVTRRQHFAAWAATRRVPFEGPVPSLTIRCIVLAHGAASETLERTLATVRAQTLAAETVALTDLSVGSPSDLLSDAAALCVLHAGDALEPDAFALLAASLGGADLAYADEVDADGAPRLKPDWSPDLARATGYVGRVALVSRALIERLPNEPLGSVTEAADTLGRLVAEACRRAVHCPRPLATVAATPSYSAREVAWPLPDPAPLVSVIIPSRDRLDLISTVSRGLLEATDYPAIELIVVDNGSTDPAVLAYYEKLKRDSRVQIVSFPQAFNFSAMVNAGVAAASGQVVVLLNNDIGVRGPGWLGAMVRQAIRPEVGAVGAKLLFGDGTLQHAGVVVGLAGRAGHILRRRPADTPGHLGRLHVAHEVSAVTAACLAVSRDKYLAVGGFDAEAFPIDFNDVDFCLRLGAKGWKTIWTPEAELFHFESVSRGPSVGAKRERFEREAALFTARWLDVIRHDPFYHPALSLTTFGEDLE
ncbi:glycosyltransferase family 2 protein [Methylobacterium litchii]|uniref:glycosyltransferase family 2 protein n=1 Tax=Methylobacterium litchii TaxID=3138810 RepID=UPI00399CA22A